MTLCCSVWICFLIWDQSREQTAPIIFILQLLGALLQLLHAGPRIWPSGQGSPSCSQIPSHSCNILSLLSPNILPRGSLLSLFSKADQTLNLSLIFMSHQNLSSDLILMFNPGPRDQLRQLSLPLAGPFTAAIAKLPFELPPTPPEREVPGS